MRKVMVIVLAGLLVSLSFLPGARAEGLLSDFFGMIKKWFESSPLGNIFTVPVKRVEMIKLSFYPESFELNAGEFINITTSTSEVGNFKGAISIDMKGKAVFFKEAGSSLLIKEGIGTVNIYGIKINSLDLRNLKLVLVSGNWNETTENGSLTINDFLGNGIIKEGVIELEGNVSRITRG